MKLPNSLSEAGEMAQVASLPTKGEAQSSNPRTAPPQKKPVRMENIIIFIGIISCTASLRKQSIEL
jgi:hypothetical protein